VDGRVTVRWERVACPVVGDVEVEFADGSNRFYVDFLVQNHRYGVASVAFVTEGGQTPIPRESYNRFVFASGIAPPVQLRITATTGQVLEHTFASVEGNSTSIPIGAQFAVCTDSFFRNGFEG
jgi:expansin (peptidoglycan-binding protein)